MTGRGIVGLALFALMLLVGLSTGISEIFVAAFTAGFLLLLALASALAGAFLLRVQPSVPVRSLVRGGELKAETVLSGTFVLPVAVEMTWLSPDGSRRFAAFLWGRERRRIPCQFPCPHRGLWPTGVVRLRCGDLFGLFSLPVSAKRRPVPPAQVLVYPELYGLPGQPPRPFPSMDYSEKNTVISDQGDSFSDTRLYRQGDPMKRIHWKMSIRTGELYTRQYEMLLDQVTFLFVDNSRLEGEAPEDALGYADMAAECAAALAYYYLSHGRAVRLICSHGGLDAWSMDGFEEMYTYLAGMEFDEEQPAEDWIPQALEEARHACACHLITRRPDPAVLEWMIGVPSPRRPASLICTAAGMVPVQAEAVEQGLRILPISAPRDILERLGEEA